MCEVGGGGVCVCGVWGGIVVTQISCYCLSLTEDNWV